MEHRGAQSWLRQQWREFKKGPPGERFKKLYERRERAPHTRLKKALYFSLGLIAIALGIVTYPIQVIPSDPIILIGIAAMAQASWYGSRALDWLELKLRVPFRPLAKLWRRLPRWGKIALSILWSGLAAFAGYGVYRLFAD